MAITPAGPITDGKGRHPSSTGHMKIARDPGTKGSAPRVPPPKGAAHLHEKKMVAHKPGKYGEAQSSLAHHPETAKTGSPITKGGSASQKLYPQKLGLRGKVIAD